MHRFKYKNATTFDLLAVGDEICSKTTIQEITMSEYMLPWITQPCFPKVKIEFILTNKIRIT